MSFILKSQRLVTGLRGFTRQAKPAFKKRKIYLSSWQCLFKVNQTFNRFSTLAPENRFLQSHGNIKETFYEKSIGQVYFDFKRKGYICREDFDSAWMALKSSTTFTTEQTAVLIKCCGHSLPLNTASEKLELVKEVWDSFDDIGIKKTIDHYNALLDVYIELEHKFSPKDFLNNLNKQQVTPNLQTYKRLLLALSIQGKISTAQEFLEHMKINSVNIDDGVFKSLILGYSLQGDFISARGILEIMKQKGFEPSSEAYVNLALGYAKMGDIDKVKEIVDECNKQSGLFTTDFLEIAYTFAAYNHSEHFPTVLDMISLEKNFPIVSTRVVHRLLHRKLDREAFMIFQLRDKLGSAKMVQEPLQMFLDHYVRFREPLEVLNMSKIFQEKGWSSIAFAYCLKETLIRKDVPHCLEFLQTLKIQGYPLRVHYFYPVLVKSHKLGNEEVIKIIRHMLENDLVFGREVIKSFNKFYDFVPGAELDDLAKLEEAGVNKTLIAWKILDILLCREDIDAAFKLVSTSRIAYPGVFLPTAMALGFRNHESEPEKFMNILYYLIHNMKVNKMVRGTNHDVHPFEYEQFFVETAKRLNKTFNLGVLEEMLKKKIPLTSLAGSIMSTSFPCAEVTDLVSKLTSPDFKIEFDETLLTRLIKMGEKQHENKMKFSIQKEGEDDWSKLFEALEKQEKVPDDVKNFMALTRKRVPPVDHESQMVAERAFTHFSLKGDVANTERVFRIGVRKGLIKADHYGHCVTAHLVSGNLDSAAKRYYQGLKKTRKSKMLETLVRKIKENKDYLLLNDINASISKVFSENFAATQLLAKFAKLGYHREMNTILQSRTEILHPLISTLCPKQPKEMKLKYFENLEKVSRSTTKLDLNLLYNKLLNVYVSEGQLEKILNLYVTLERDDIMKEDIQKQFVNCLENWSGDVPENLKYVLQCILKGSKGRKALEGEGILKKAWRKNFSVEHASSKMESNVNSDESILKCFCLVQTGKIDEYFKFLEKRIEQDGPKKAEKCFFCYKLVPHMTKKQEYIIEYEKLVRRCNSLALWKNYIQLCLSLNYVNGIQRAMNELKYENIRFCLKDVSFQDCLRVFKSDKYREKLKKKLRFFYAEMIRKCKDSNEVEMVKKLSSDALADTS